MKLFVTLSCLLAVVQAFPADRRVRRGAAIAPGGGYNQIQIEPNYAYGASAAGAAGTIDYAAANAVVAAQIANEKAVAGSAASGAIAASVADNYNQQLATTAQFVAQYTQPNSYQSLHAAYNAINAQQASGQIAGAITAAGPSIWQAVNGAVSSNYATAYQTAQTGAIAANAADAATLQAVIGSGAGYNAAAASAASAAQASSAANAYNVGVDAVALQAIAGIQASGAAAGTGYGYGH